MKAHVALNIAIISIIGLVSGQEIDMPIPCRYTSDCVYITTLPSGAFCKDGFCMCPGADGGEGKNCSSIGASIHVRRASGPLVYRTCKHNQDCSFQGGFCNSTIKQCECAKNYVPSSNKQHCVKKVQSLGSSCRDKNQCLAFLANTTCQANKCTCELGYHHVDNACWRMAEFGRSCTENQECSHIEDAICVDNKTCGCAAEMVLNVDGKRCLAVARNIQDECVEPVQCLTTFEHSSCVNGTCQCQEAYHYVSEMTKCFRNQEIDTPCANSYECYQAEDYESDPSIRSLMCEANLCTCADSHIREENRCVNAGLSLVALWSMIVPLTVLICGLW